MTNRVLITGAAGLLGRALVHEAKAEYDVVALVHRSRLPDEDVEQVHADVSDLHELREIVERTDPDLVINAAALVRRDDCEADPALTELMNVAMPATLAEVLRATGARLVHVSSDAVYGLARQPFNELTRPEPEGTYACSKLRSEEAVLAWHPEALVLRTNFFGWSASGWGSLAEFFLNELWAGRSVPGFTDVEFTPLYTRDLAALMLEAARIGVSGIRNLGSSEPMTAYEFGRHIALTFGLDPDRVRPVSRHAVGPRATRSPVLSMDSSRVAGELGTDLPSIASGIARMREETPAGLPSPSPVPPAVRSR